MQSCARDSSVCDQGCRRAWKSANPAHVHAVSNVSTTTPSRTSASRRYGARTNVPVHSTVASAVSWLGRPACPAEIPSAAWVSGAACLVDRAAFDSVGGFDEAFFLFKEEEDLLLRMRRRGGRVLYLPTVRVRHEGGVVASRAEHMPSSMARFTEKHVRRGRLVVPLNRAVTVWGGRLDRLLGR